jgi:hypothetical protein
LKIEAHGSGPGGRYTPGPELPAFLKEWQTKLPAHTSHTNAYDHTNFRYTVDRAEVRDSSALNGPFNLIQPRVYLPELEVLMSETFT